jgi:hypothetical protein
MKGRGEKGTGEEGVNPGGGRAVSVGGAHDDLAAKSKTDLAPGEKAVASATATPAIGEQEAGARPRAAISREGRRRPHLPPSRRPPVSRRQELVPPGEGSSSAGRRGGRICHRRADHQRSGGRS